ncbi:MAG: hypothetical protein J6M02_06240 [Clostridia bacterium]|nr:hypothetical protein [Clostridia bacterium]
MFKNLIRFSLLLIILLLLLTCGLVIKLYRETNTIYVTPSNYASILEDAHENIDKYLNKKIIVTGYVYIQEDFSENRFVIAQNIYLDYVPSSEPFIVGFLCENASNYNLIPNQTIRIIGKIQRGVYNNLEYPIVKVTQITPL